MTRDEIWFAFVVLAGLAVVIDVVWNLWLRSAIRRWRLERKDARTFHTGGIVDLARSRAVSRGDLVDRPSVLSEARWGPGTEPWWQLFPQRVLPGEGRIAVTARLWSPGNLPGAVLEWRIAAGTSEGATEFTVASELEEAEADYIAIHVAEELRVLIRDLKCISDRQEAERA